MSNLQNTVPGGQGGPVLINVVSREDVTHQQVHTVLSIIQTMAGVLSRAPSLDDDEKNPGLDGGTSSAAQSTLIRACDRLDSILDDKSRWELGKENELHEAMVRLHDAQANLVRGQKEIAENYRRPSVMFRPSIAMVEGTGTVPHFIVYYGDIDRAGCSIIGRGPTPEAALLDFDEAFRRTPEQQLQMILNLPKRKRTPPNEPTPE